MEARGDTETCAICIETMIDDNTVKTLLDPCFHMFHSRCIFTCYFHSLSSDESFKCPTCRTPMINFIPAENFNPPNLLWSETHCDNKFLQKSYKQNSCDLVILQKPKIPSGYLHGGWIMTVLTCFFKCYHSFCLTWGGKNSRNYKSWGPFSHIFRMYMSVLLFAWAYWIAFQDAL